jgi:hypothetical protein
MRVSLVFSSLTLLPVRYSITAGNVAECSAGPVATTGYKLRIASMCCEFYFLLYSGCPLDFQLPF